MNVIVVCEDDDEIREAADILSTLIERVTIYPEGAHGPAAEVVARVSDIMSFATNENGPRRGCGGGRSVELVAGTRNRPKHTLAIVAA